jgi:hypothetical protein
MFSFLRDKVFALQDRVVDRVVYAEADF